MPVFQSGGLALAFDDIGPRGKSPSIVLVHGFSSNRNEAWRRTGWFHAFERKGIRCAALDLRGHGESAKPHDPELYSSAAMESDIVALLDHLGLAKVDLMGYSMGARLSLAIACNHTARVDRLIVGGIGGSLFEPPREQGEISMAEAMEAPDPETIKDPMQRSFRQFADEQGEDRLALAACTRGLREPVDKAALGALNVPTLVVAGARDKLAGDPQVLADAIPGARTVTLPGCDHFYAIPHALYKAAVMDFLEGYLE